MRLQSKSWYRNHWHANAFKRSEEYCYYLSSQIHIMPRRSTFHSVSVILFFMSSSSLVIIMLSFRAIVWCHVLCYALLYCTMSQHPDKKSIKSLLLLLLLLLLVCYTFNAPPIHPAWKIVFYSSHHLLYAIEGLSPRRSLHTCLLCKCKCVCLSVSNAMFTGIGIILLPTLLWLILPSTYFLRRYFFVF